MKLLPILASFWEPFGSILGTTRAQQIECKFGCDFGHEKGTKNDAQREPQKPNGPFKKHTFFEPTF